MLKPYGWNYKPPHIKSDAFEIAWLIMSRSSMKTCGGNIKEFTGHFGIRFRVWLLG